MDEQVIIQLLRAKADQEAVSIDEDLLPYLYDKYSPVCYGLLLKNVPPKEAEELLIEIFLSVRKSIYSYNPTTGSLTLWFARLTIKILREKKPADKLTVFGVNKQWMKCRLLILLGLALFITS